MGSDDGLSRFHLRYIGPESTTLDVPAVIELNRVTTVIGRSPARANVVLGQPNVVISRRHARIVCIRDSRHKLFDDSLNGVFVNDEKINGNVVLNEGDSITFGHPNGANLKAGHRARQPDSPYQYIYEHCDCARLPEGAQHVQDVSTGLQTDDVPTLSRPPQIQPFKHDEDSQVFRVPALPASVNQPCQSGVERNRTSTLPPLHHMSDGLPCRQRSSDGYSQQGASNDFASQHISVDQPASHGNEHDKTSNIDITNSQPPVITEKPPEENISNIHGYVVSTTGGMPSLSDANISLPQMDSPCTECITPKEIVYSHSTHQNTLQSSEETKHTHSPAASQRHMYRSVLHSSLFQSEAPTPPSSNAFSSFQSPEELDLSSSDDEASSSNMEDSEEDPLRAQGHEDWMVRKVQKKKKSLGVETKLLQLNIQIKKMLASECPSIDRFMAVFEDLAQLPITKHLLNKHPDILRSVKKCRKYRGNEDVRKKALSIYNKFNVTLSDETPARLSRDACFLPRTNLANRIKHATSALESCVSKVSPEKIVPTKSDWTGPIDAGDSGIESESTTPVVTPRAGFSEIPCLLTEQQVPLKHCSALQDKTLGVNVGDESVVAVQVVAEMTAKPQNASSPILSLSGGTSTEGINNMPVELQMKNHSSIKQAATASACHQDPNPLEADMEHRSCGGAMQEAIPEPELSVEEILNPDTVAETSKAVIGGQISETVVRPESNSCVHTSDELVPEPELPETKQSDEGISSFYEELSIEELQNRGSELTIEDSIPDLELPENKQPDDVILDACTFEQASKEAKNHQISEVGEIEICVYEQNSQEKTEMPELQKGENGAENGNNLPVDIHPDNVCNKACQPVVSETAVQCAKDWTVDSSLSTTADVHPDILCDKASHVATEQGVASEFDGKPIEKLLQNSMLLPSLDKTDQLQNAAGVPETAVQCAEDLPVDSSLSATADVHPNILCDKASHVATEQEVASEFDGKPTEKLLQNSMLLPVQDTNKLENAAGVPETAVQCAEDLPVDSSLSATADVHPNILCDKASHVATEQEVASEFDGKPTEKLLQNSMLLPSLDKTEQLENESGVSETAVQCAKDLTVDSSLSTTADVHPDILCDKASHVATEQEVASELDGKPTEKLLQNSMLLPVQDTNTLENAAGVSETAVQCAEDLPVDSSLSATADVHPDILCDKAGLVAIEQEVASELDGKPTEKLLENSMLLPSLDKTNQLENESGVSETAVQCAEAATADVHPDMCDKAGRVATEQEVASEFDGKPNEELLENSMLLPVQDKTNQLENEQGTSETAVQHGEDLTVESSSASAAIYLEKAEPTALLVMAAESSKHLNPQADLQSLSRQYETSDSTELQVTNVPEASFPTAMMVSGSDASVLKVTVDNDGAQQPLGVETQMSHTRPHVESELQGLGEIPDESQKMATDESHQTEEISDAVVIPFGKNTALEIDHPGSVTEFSEMETVSQVDVEAVASDLDMCKSEAIDLNALPEAEGSQRIQEASLEHHCGVDASADKISQETKIKVLVSGEPEIHTRENTNVDGALKDTEPVACEKTVVGGDVLNAVTEPASSVETELGSAESVSSDGLEISEQCVDGASLLQVTSELMGTPVMKINASLSLSDTSRDHNKVPVSSCDSLSTPLASDEPITPNEMEELHAVSEVEIDPVSSADRVMVEAVSKPETTTAAGQGTTAELIAISPCKGDLNSEQIVKMEQCAGSDTLSEVMNKPSGKYNEVVEVSVLLPQSAVTGVEVTEEVEQLPTRQLSGRLEGTEQTVVSISEEHTPERDEILSTEKTTIVTETEMHLPAIGELESETAAPDKTTATTIEIQLATSNDGDTIDDGIAKASVQESTSSGHVMGNLAAELLPLPAEEQHFDKLTGISFSTVEHGRAPECVKSKKEAQVVYGHAYPLNKVANDASVAADGSCSATQEPGRHAEDKTEVLNSKREALVQEQTIGPASLTSELESVAGDKGHTIIPVLVKESVQAGPTETDHTGDAIDTVNADISANETLVNDVSAPEVDFRTSKNTDIFNKETSLASSSALVDAAQYCMKETLNKTVPQITERTTNSKSDPVIEPVIQIWQVPEKGVSGVSQMPVRVDLEWQTVLGPQVAKENQKQRRGRKRKGSNLVEGTASKVYVTERTHRDTGTNESPGACRSGDRHERTFFSQLANFFQPKEPKKVSLPIKLGQWNLKYCTMRKLVRDFFKKKARQGGILENVNEGTNVVYEADKGEITRIAKTSKNTSHKNDAPGCIIEEVNTEPEQETRIHCMETDETLHEKHNDPAEIIVKDCIEHCTSEKDACTVMDTIESTGIIERKNVLQAETCTQMITEGTEKPVSIDMPKSVIEEGNRKYTDEDTIKAVKGTEIVTWNSSQDPVLDKSCDVKVPNDDREESSGKYSSGHGNTADQNVLYKVAILEDENCMSQVQKMSHSIEAGSKGHFMHSVEAGSKGHFMHSVEAGSEGHFTEDVSQCQDKETLSKDDAEAQVPERVAKKSIPCAVGEAKSTDKMTSVEAMSDSNMIFRERPLRPVSGYLSKCTADKEELGDDAISQTDDVSSFHKRKPVEQVGKDFFDQSSNGRDNECANENAKIETRVKTTDKIHNALVCRMANVTDIPGESSESIEQNRMSFTPTCERNGAVLETDRNIECQKNAVAESEKFADPGLEETNAVEKGGYGLAQKDVLQAQAPVEPQCRDTASLETDETAKHVNLKVTGPDSNCLESAETELAGPVKPESGVLSKYVQEQIAGMDVYADCKNVEVARTETWKPVGIVAADSQGPCDSEHMEIVPTEIDKKLEKCTQKETTAEPWNSGHMGIIETGELADSGLTEMAEPETERHAVHEHSKVTVSETSRLSDSGHINIAGTEIEKEMPANCGHLDIAKPQAEGSTASKNERSTKCKEMLVGPSDSECKKTPSTEVEKNSNSVDVEGAVLEREGSVDRVHSEEALDRVHSEEAVAETDDAEKVVGERTEIAHDVPVKKHVPETDDTDNSVPQIQGIAGSVHKGKTGREADGPVKSQHIELAASLDETKSNKFCTGVTTIQQRVNTHEIAGQEVNGAGSKVDIMMNETPRAGKSLNESETEDVAGGKHIAETTTAKSFAMQDRVAVTASSVEANTISSEEATKQVLTPERNDETIPLVLADHECSGIEPKRQMKIFETVKDSKDAQKKLAEMDEGCTVAQVADEVGCLVENPVDQGQMEETSNRVSVNITQVEQLDVSIGHSAKEPEMYVDIRPDSQQIPSGQSVDMEHTPSQESNESFSDIFDENELANSKTRVSRSSSPWPLETGIDDLYHYDDQDSDVGEPTQEEHADSTAPDTADADPGDKGETRHRDKAVRDQAIRPSDSPSFGPESEDEEMPKLKWHGYEDERHKEDEADVEDEGSEGIENDQDSMDEGQAGDKYDDDDDDTVQEDDDGLKEKLSRLASDRVNVGGASEDAGFTSNCSQQKDRPFQLRPLKCKRQNFAANNQCEDSKDSSDNMSSSDEEAGIEPGKKTSPVFQSRSGKKTEGMFDSDDEFSSPEIDTAFLESGGEENTETSYDDRRQNFAIPGTSRQQPAFREATSKRLGAENESLNRISSIGRDFVKSRVESFLCSQVRSPTVVKLEASQSPGGRISPAGSGKNLLDQLCAKHGIKRPIKQEERSEEDSDGSTGRSKKARLSDANSTAKKAEEYVTRCKGILGHLDKTMNSRGQFINVARVQAWQSDIDKLMEKATLPKTVIAVVGDTGSGKSTLMNALLDHVDILPTSGMRACTSVVVEITNNTRNRNYEADVEFLTAQEWESELKLLLKELERKDGKIKVSQPDPKSDAGVAWSKIRAVYGVFDKNVTLTKLKQENRVTRWLDRVKTISERDVRDFRQQIDEYIEPADLGVGDQFWPIVKHVSLRIPNCSICSSGATLVDLPGIRDSNPARDKIAKEFLKNCNAVWVVASVHRAVDDRTAKELLGTHFRRQLLMDGQYGSVSFVCTKTDQIRPSEIIRPLKLQSKVKPVEDEIFNLETEVSALKDEVKELQRKIPCLKKQIKEQKAECQELATGIQHIMSTQDIDQEDDVNQLDQLTQVLNNQNEQMQELSSQLEQLRYTSAEKQKRVMEIDNLMISLRREITVIAAKGRNKYTAQEIRKDFKAGIKEMRHSAGMQQEDEEGDMDDEEEDELDSAANNLKVFCVSSVEYLKMTNKIENDGPAQVFGTKEETGVPHLQAFVHEMTAIRKRQSAENLVRHLACFTMDVANYLLSEGSKHKEIRENVRAVFDTHLLHLKNDVKPLIEKLGRDIDKAFDQNLAPRLDDGVNVAVHKTDATVAKWGKPVNRDAKELGGLCWSTYQAVCRRNGSFNSPSVGRIDFNEQLAEPVYTSITISWDRLFNSYLWQLLKTCQDGVLGGLRRFGQALEEEFSTLGVIKGRTHHAAQQILQGATGNLNNAISALRDFITDQQREEHMSPGYDKCAQERGPGTFDRMRAHMARHSDASKHVMFDAASNKLLSELSALKNRILAEMQKLCHQLYTEVTALYEPFWEAPNSTRILRDTLLPGVAECASSVKQLCSEAHIQDLNFKVPTLAELLQPQDQANLAPVHQRPDRQLQANTSKKNGKNQAPPIKKSGSNAFSSQWKSQSGASKSTYGVKSKDTGVELKIRPCFSQSNVKPVAKSLQPGVKINVGEQITSELSTSQRPSEARSCQKKGDVMSRPVKCISTLPSQFVNSSQLHESIHTSSTAARTAGFSKSGSNNSVYVPGKLLNVAFSQGNVATLVSPVKSREGSPLSSLSQPCVTQKRRNRLTLSPSKRLSQTSKKRKFEKKNKGEARAYLLSTGSWWNEPEEPQEKRHKQRSEAFPDGSDRVTVPTFTGRPQQSNIMQPVPVKVESPWAPGYGAPVNRKKSTMFEEIDLTHMDSD